MKRLTRRLAPLMAAVVVALALAATGGLAPAAASAAPLPQQLDIIPGDPADMFPCMVNPVECFLEDMTAELAEEASAFLLDIFSEVTDAARFNPSAPGFMQQYVLGLTIALFVMTVLLMKLFYKMSRDPEKMPQYRQSLMHHLPLGLVMCAVGPGIGAMLADAAHALTDAIIEYSGSSDEIYDTVDTTVESLKDSDTPAIAILLLFGLIIAGIMVIITLLLQTLALYLTGSVMAIAFIMTIDPDMRPRAAKLPMTWLGILLSKPLLFFMMGTVVKLITGGGLADENPDVAILLALLALLVVALAPLSLRKFAPIIPNEASAPDASGAVFSGGAELASKGKETLGSHGSGSGGSGGGLGTGAASQAAQIGSSRAADPATQGSMSLAMSNSTMASTAGSITSSSPLQGFLASSAAPAGGSALLGGTSLAGGGGASLVGGGAAAAGGGAAVAGGGTAAATAGSGGAALPVAAAIGAIVTAASVAKSIADAAAPSIGGSE